MPTVRYDFAQAFGGTPAGQSRKTFKRINANSALIHSQIHYDHSHWGDARNPCLQNSLEAIATITGQSQFYDVVVMVSGLAVELGTRSAGIPQVTGGLSWHFDDASAAMRVNGLMLAKAPPQIPKVTPIAYQFAMRIPDNIPTRVALTATAGGMTVTNPAAGGLVALTNLSVLQIDIIIYAAFIRVNQINVPDLGKPVVTPGTNATRDTEDYGYHLRQVDQDLTVTVATAGAYQWNDEIPTDAASLKKFAAALNVDLGLPAPSTKKKLTGQ